jgi:SpoVK/Ycf46/Vps4 family AAA+-type ATPase
LSQARAKRDEARRVQAADAASLKTVRVALDAMTAAVWNDVFRCQRRITDGRNLLNSLKLGWYGKHRWKVMLLIVLPMMIPSSHLKHLTAVLISFAVYACFVALNFFIFRTQSIEYLRAAQRTLGDMGRDIRLVSFQRIDASRRELSEIYEGPLVNGALFQPPEAWTNIDFASDITKEDVLVQVMDAEGKVVMLSQFPGKKPLHLYTDVNNPFIRDYRGHLQWAMERRLESLRAVTQKFRQAMEHSCALLAAENRVIVWERELNDYERMKHLWTGVILPEEVKESIARRVRMFRVEDPAAPRGLLLFGPPGTGKTLVAQTIAKVAGAAFIPLSLGDIKLGYVGQSAQRVKEIFSKARQQRSIIFVDECESVFGKRSSVESDAMTNEIVQTILAEWGGINDDGRVWVIGSTNRRDLLDEAAVSRFGSLIEILLPDGGGRRRIIEESARRLEAPFEVSDELVKATSGMSGRDLEQLVREAKTESFGRAVTSDDLVHLAVRLRSRMSTNVGETASWENLILPDATKEHLQTITTMLVHAESMKLQGIDLPRGMLLSGPPGTGKTEIARTIANEGGLQFIGVTLADVKAGYIGQSGQKMKALFERARANAPSILFFDEVDNIVPSTEFGTHDALASEMIGQMLQEMDGINAHAGHVFVVAATNYPERIQPAIRSRLSEVIEIPLPDREARMAILRRFLRGKPLGFELPDMLRKLADQTEGKSGRDLRSLVEQAMQKGVMRAIRAGTPDKIQITLADFGIRN